MAYTTVANIVTALPTIVGSSSHVSTATLGQHLAMVEAYMQGRLAQRFTLPLSGEYPLLAGIANDLTVYRVLVQRVYTGADGEQDKWLARWKEAGKLLDMIVDGEIGLITDAGSPAPESSVEIGAVWSSTMDCAPIFGGCCVDRAPGTVDYGAGEPLPYSGGYRYGW